jgi:hypothetical protein
MGGWGGEFKREYRNKIFWYALAWGPLPQSDLAKYFKGVA